MALFSERRRLAAIEDREAQGEELWSLDLTDPVRVKLVQVLQAHFPHSSFDPGDWPRIAQSVRHARGVFKLTPGNLANHQRDVATALLSGDVEMVADVLEAACEVMSLSAEYRLAALIRDFNDVLAAHRVAFEVIDAQVVLFSSRVMHTATVVPALSLLAGDARFAGAESAFQDALRELGSEDGAADAITDAGTALQEMLVALGCEGNALGPLVKSARAKGLIGASDQRLERGIVDVVEWVAADRSTTGDSHNATRASREDAWLTVHVVGALMVRLASGTPRAAGAS